MAFPATFALLIPTVGGGPLSEPIRILAELTAVALTSITTDANGEDGVALKIHIRTQPEDWLRRVDDSKHRASISPRAGKWKYFDNSVELTAAPDMTG